MNNTSSLRIRANWAVRAIIMFLIVVTALVIPALVGMNGSIAFAATTNGTMLLAQDTTPRGAVWLGTHLWVSDGVLGICRVDPAPAANPPWQRSNCSGAVKAGGQIAIGGNAPTPKYPAGSKYVYIADSSTKSNQIVRYVWNATNETLVDSLAIQVVPDSTRTGGGSGRTVGVAAQVGANGVATTLYVGYIRSGDIMKLPAAETITSANAGNGGLNPPTSAAGVTKIGSTTDGRGLNALLFFNNDLYLGELGGQGLSIIPDPSGLTRPACTSTAVCAAVTVRPTPSFFPGGLATDGTFIYIGDAAVTGANSILRFNPANGVVDIYSNAISPSYVFVNGATSTTITGYVGPLGLGIAPNGDLYVGDDPGFALATPPLNQGHFWKIPFTAAPPAVTGIAPTSGTSLGGTVVTITGTGFSIAAGATTVNFGANAGTNVSCASATSCTATSPAGTGVVDVIVSVVGQPSAANPSDQFTYVTPPPATAVAISAIAPTSGATTGGTTVTITGQNFVTGTVGVSVNFGANAATGVNCASTTSCTAVSPAGAAGTVDVQITVNGHTSPVVAGDRFTYITPVATLYAWGVTAPKGGATWLVGNLGGHWWSSDHSQGLCRQDPVPGTSLRAINFATCASDLIGSAGQAVYDPRTNVNGTHYVYVPDNAVKSTAVWRLTFDPATETMVADPAGGALATAMTPLADVRTLKPNGMALGPDGNLYVTDLVEKNVRQITNPNGDPRTQVITIVAVTGDGRGANGTQGFIGNLLYISGNRASQFFDITQCPMGATPCGMASVPAVSGIFVAGTTVDAPHKLVYISNSPGGASATIYRYDASKDVYVAFPAGSVAPDLNGVVTCPNCTVGSTAVSFITGGTLPAAGTPNATVFCALTCTRPWDFANHPTQGGVSGFAFVFGMGVAPDGTLAITEDPSAGARSGRGTMWTVPYIP